MISIRSSADMARALASPPDADIARLLALRRDQLLERGGWDLAGAAHLVVVQPGDALAAVEAEAGWPLSTDLDGCRLGEPGFSPPFDWVEAHPGGWREAVAILSDDGFALVLFVPDRPGVDPRLLALVRQPA